MVWQGGCPGLKVSQSLAGGGARQRGVGWTVPLPNPEPGREQGCGPYCRMVQQLRYTVSVCLTALRHWGPVDKVIHVPVFDF